MNIIDIAYALTAPVEAVIFFMMMDTFFETKKRNSIWKYLIGIIILTIFIKLVNNFFLFKLGNLVGIVLSVFLISIYYYQTVWYKRILVPLLTWVIMGAAEILVLNLTMVIFDVTAAQSINTPPYLIVGVITSKATAFAICYAIRIKNRCKELELGKTYWFLFLLLFFSSAIATFLIYWMLYVLNNTTYNIPAFICTIGLYFSTFLALYLYARSQRQNQIIRYQEQAEQQMRSQIKHMDELVLKQNELRALRHDMNGHLIALKGFFDAKDYKGGSQYIKNLGEQFRQTAPSINTGNNALDAILSAKRSLAESKGIAFRTSITIQKDLPIAPEDCSVIFGNALDNALEACDRLPADAAKSIKLFLQQDATSINCKITNTAPPNDEKNFATSKADKANHGFGMKNMQEALEKYPSLYNFKQQEDQFEFSFSIFY